MDQPLPPGAEISTKLQEKTIKFLKDDTEIAVLVDNFVMNSNKIILNVEIVPTFWEHFSPKHENIKAGFDQFCSAIGRLYADVKVPSPLQGEGHL